MDFEQQFYINTMIILTRSFVIKITKKPHDSHMS